METKELRAKLAESHASNFGWALACCRRDVNEAEEVLQNVYVKVLVGKARFDGNASFKTWLFAVIRKTAADQRRKRLLRSMIVMRASEYSASQNRSQHPEHAAYRSEIKGVFLRALAVLPTRQREALELVFYHDLRLQEAAEVMGVSIGSARTHYERGKKRLRKLLEESEQFYEFELGRKENTATVR
jgi:RNA polymerase sigma factor (sigma-70 family)